jgi:hypothetical protein
MQGTNPPGAACGSPRRKAPEVEPGVLRPRPVNDHGPLPLPAEIGALAGVFDVALGLDILPQLLQVRRPAQDLGVQSGLPHVASKLRQAEVQPECQTTFGRELKMLPAPQAPHLGERGGVLQELIDRHPRRAVRGAEVFHEGARSAGRSSGVGNRIRRSSANRAHWSRPKMITWRLSRTRAGRTRAPRTSCRTWSASAISGSTGRCRVHGM